MGEENDTVLWGFYRSIVNNEKASWEMKTFANLWLRAGDKMRAKLRVSAIKIREDYKNGGLC